MAHTPQHPDNPCRESLPEADQTPAKMWELLRRNGTFKKAVARLTQLGGRAKAAVNKIEELRARKVELGQDTQAARQLEAECGRRTETAFLARRMLQNVGKTHVFAAAALEWLVPEIWFEVRHAAIAPGVDSHGLFTLNDSWHNAPHGFKRAFRWLWRKCDSRAKNPITGCRTDAPQEHETDFFQKERYMDAINRVAKTGQMEVEDFDRSLRFDDLAEKYRVFAFPKSIRTRMEARRLADWIFESLCRLPAGGELPKQESTICGTPIQWDVYLFALKCNDASLFAAYKQIKPGVVAIDRKRKWRKEQLNYIQHFRAIEGEIAAIFPVKGQHPKC